MREEQKEKGGAKKKKEVEKSDSETIYIYKRRDGQRDR